jgi:hypothetical protein
MADARHDEEQKERQRRPGAGEGEASEKITASDPVPEPESKPIHNPASLTKQEPERPPAQLPDPLPEQLPAQLVAIDPEVPVQREGASGRRFQRTVTDRHERTIRSTPPVYRWVCPCQNPPVLLATYGPNARINIKVRDRYWHLQGFGMVEAICPRCAAEHMLDMRLLRHALGDSERASSIEHDDPATAD